MYFLKCPPPPPKLCGCGFQHEESRNTRSAAWRSLLLALWGLSLITTHCLQHRSMAMSGCLLVLSQGCFPMLCSSAHQCDATPKM